MNIVSWVYCTFILDNSSDNNISAGNINSCEEKLRYLVKVDSIKEGVRPFKEYWNDIKDLLGEDNDAEVNSLSFLINSMEYIENDATVNAKFSAWACTYLIIELENLAFRHQTGCAFLELSDSMYDFALNNRNEEAENRAGKALRNLKEAIAKKEDFYEQNVTRISVRANIFIKASDAKRIFLLRRLARSHAIEIDMREFQIEKQFNYYDFLNLFIYGKSSRMFAFPKCSKMLENILFPILKSGCIEWNGYIAFKLCKDEKYAESILKSLNQLLNEKTKIGLVFDGWSEEELTFILNDVALKTLKDRVTVVKFKECKGFSGETILLNVLNVFVNLEKLELLGCDLNVDDAKSMLEKQNSEYLGTDRIGFEFQKDFCKLFIKKRKGELVNNSECNLKDAGCGTSLRN